jgi:hypothetical protein
MPWWNRYSAMNDENAFALQGKTNLLNEDEQARLMANPASANILQDARAAQQARDAAQGQVRTQSGLRNLNFGASLHSALEMPLSALAKADFIEGEGFWPEVGRGAANAGAVAGMAVAETAGDFAGGLVRGLGMQQEAAGAATRAGSFAEARNDQARDALIGGAGKQAEAMNAANAAAGAGLNDSAIGSAFNSANAYAAMDSSGVEGSNMERNIRYGMGKDAAQRELAADMMGRQGQDMSDSLAHSFDQLSQNKAAAQQQAWGGVVNNYHQGLNDEYLAAGKQEFEVQGTMADEQMAAMQAQAEFDRLSPEEQAGINEQLKKEKEKKAGGGA